MGSRFFNLEKVDSLNEEKTDTLIDTSDNLEKTNKEVDRFLTFIGRNII